MASQRPPACLMSQIQQAICQICGQKMHSDGREPKKSYQKQVDPPRPAYGLCDDDDVELPPSMQPDPVPRPKPSWNTPETPLITNIPVIEYRVTSEARRKPANIPGLRYVVNHTALDRADVEEWVAKTKRMKEMGESWVGDGSYIEPRPEMIHFFGLTTHLFAKNPEKPYGSLPAPAIPYTQVIPDQRYEEIEALLRRRKGQEDQEESKPLSLPIQLCLPFPWPTSTAASGEKPDGPKKEGFTPSAAMKSACLPTGGPGGNCPPPVKMMLCLPCPPPDCKGGHSAGAAERPSKPRDYTYRCESRELRAGNLYTCCQCIKRNGLQHDCPRTPCQGRPACLSKPWPDCWPSGGCHGIDFSRERGVSRYNPCSELRMDKKECKPPGALSGPKADCGGNMMVLLCPPSNYQK